MVRAAASVAADFFTRVKSERFRAEIYGLMDAAIRAVEEHDPDWAYGTSRVVMNALLRLDSALGDVTIVPKEKG
jgi:hypothetical protein